MKAAGTKIITDPHCEYAFTAAPVDEEGFILPCLSVVANGKEIAVVHADDDAKALAKAYLQGREHGVIEIIEEVQSWSAEYEPPFRDVRTITALPSFGHIDDALDFLRTQVAA